LTVDPRRALVFAAAAEAAAIETTPVAVAPETTPVTASAEAGEAP
jgi:hypothetical protein